MSSGEAFVSDYLVTLIPGMFDGGETLQCSRVNVLHEHERHTDGFAYYSPRRRQFLNRSEIKEVRPLAATPSPDRKEDQ